MKRYTHRYINQAIGGFVLLALLILMSVVYMGGRGHHWFERTISLGLLLPEEGSFGLKTGAAVIILGAEAGEVTDIDITSDDRMVARMAVRQDFARFIGTDSHATIKKVLGMAGDAYVDISGPPGQPLPDGMMVEAVLDRAVMERLQETLEQIRTELLPAIRSIRLAAESHVQLTNSLKDPAVKTLETISSIATTIDKGEGTVNRVLTDKQLADHVSMVVDRTNLMLEETAAAAGELKTAAARVGRSARKLSHSMEQFPETVRRANITLESIHKVSENLVRATALMPETIRNFNNQVVSLSGVVIQAQATLREIQRLTEAAQRHWLLRKYVEDDLPTVRIPPKEVFVTP